jgi:predicted XRE-type DNA-binding protein
MTDKHVTRFEEKFSKGPGCWIWNASYKNERWQYGGVRFHGEVWRSHRLSYTLYIGPIPKGKAVMHTCDNPRCVNPKHLVLGTLADNNLDRAKKFRSAGKLKREDVIFIRKSDMLQNDLAKMFGICQQTVSDIIHRRHYKHVIDI